MPLQKRLLLILLLGIVRYVPAQDSTLQLTLVKSIKGKFSNFTIDKLGNIYLVNTNNEIIEYNNKFDSINSFKDLNAGNISLIDASNPLQIVVFYNESGTILLLDRQLTILNTINLNQLNILKVKNVVRSYDNNYWLFDEWDNKIKKIDDKGNILSESTDFRLLLNEVQPAENIIDYKGSLFLYNSTYGWLVFDYYLGFKKQYRYCNWKDVWIEDEMLKGIENNEIVAAFPAELIYQHIKLSLLLKKSIKILSNHLHFCSLEIEGLKIYNIKQ